MYRILRGDILSFCRHYRGPLFHGVLCDPPYELAFMGKSWDRSGVAFQRETWSAISSLLYPGAMLLAFGGSRTFHRLACAIEDADFEIRDSIVWAYGSGFPKSHDVSKAIDADAGAEREVIDEKRSGFGKRNGIKDSEGGIFINSLPEEMKHISITAPATPAAAQWSGYGTALKPAFEPIILSRKPFERGATVAETALKYGTGALNIDGCRIGLNGESPFYRSEMNDIRGGKFASGTDKRIPIPKYGNDLGRWPANLLHDGSAEVTAMFPDAKSVGVYRDSLEKEEIENNGQVFGGTPFSSPRAIKNKYAGDSGSAARFFKSCPPDDEVITRLVYRAKASRKERNAGLVGMPMYPVGSNAKGYTADVERGIDRNRPTMNHHPTCKPISLTRYLARLICPPLLSEPRRILVPFAGVGSEMIGAMLAGWDEVIGVELDSDREYIPITKARLAWWTEALRWGHTEIDAILDSFQDDDEDSDESDGDKWVQASMFD